MAAVELMPVDATPLSLAIAVSAGGLAYAAALAAVYPDLVQKLIGLIRAKRAGAEA